MLFHTSAGSAGRGARAGIDLKLSGSRVKTDCPLLYGKVSEKAIQKTKGEQLGEGESGKGMRAVYAKHILGET